MRYDSTKKCMSKVQHFCAVWEATPTLLESKLFKSIADRYTLRAMLAISSEEALYLLELRIDGFGT